MNLLKSTVFGLHILGIIEKVDDKRFEVTKADREQI